jgi:hypothetical protein
MMDFNSSSSISARMSALIDAELKSRQSKQKPREYLGASRLGVHCSRALQYEYEHQPVDPGREYSGRLLRIFERGHVTEDCMVKWLGYAGFDLRTTGVDGQQFGFSVLDGRLQGHIDGVFISGPDGFRYPALWENKCLGSRSWRDLEKNKLAISKPIYHAQIVLYQAYLGLHENPAIFTAVNADTMEIYTELVDFDPRFAQSLSDRGLRVVSASAARERLNRSYQNQTHFECRMCSWQDRCWSDS